MKYLIIVLALVLAGCGTNSGNQDGLSKGDNEAVKTAAVVALAPGKTEYCFGGLCTWRDRKVNVDELSKIIELLQELGLGASGKSNTDDNLSASRDDSPGS